MKGITFGLLILPFMGLVLTLIGIYIENRLKKNINYLDLIGVGIPAFILFILILIELCVGFDSKLYNTIRGEHIVYFTTAVLSLLSGIFTYWISNHDSGSDR